ncbi:DUF6249 domain-containing protein [Solitalea koreensis]|uniref:DUF6249 domain-containing protein n=1 Tax=Solitalea koreensis TaxID=543615 RepID=A0A521BXB0_9SPHI|nr:DUF6249 domain-containing protein [Solitalea koreensis]SMO51823.1 hypothetical protein SAMN06265350_1034 [Solitalea koreensis]
MEGILVPILISLGAFLMVFGLRYLDNKERMAMIERGMVPGARKRRSPSGVLKWGLLFIGVGVGLILAFILTNYVFIEMEEEKQTAVYFSMIFICGGIGLLGSYRVMKAEEEKEKAEKAQKEKTLQEERQLD